MSTTPAKRTQEITEHLIESLVYPVSAKHETKPMHWVGRGDEGPSYCLECCEKEVARIDAEKPEAGVIVDGGWVTECDGAEFCESCGAALDCSFTTYACESELDHFEECGFDLDSPVDCWSMERIMGSVGFLDDELTPRIKKVVRAAIRAMANAKAEGEAATR